MNHSLNPFIQKHRFIRFIGKTEQKRVTHDINIFELLNEINNRICNGSDILEDSSLARVILLNYVKKRYNRISLGAFVPHVLNSGVNLTVF